MTAARWKRRVLPIYFYRQKFYEILTYNEEIAGKKGRLWYEGMH